MHYEVTWAEGSQIVIVAAPNKEIIKWNMTILYGRLNQPFKIEETEIDVYNQHFDYIWDEKLAVLPDGP